MYSIIIKEICNSNDAKGYFILLVDVMTHCLAGI